MLLKGILFVCLTLMLPIASHGQRYLINGDSLHCFTTDEVKQLIIHKIDLYESTQLLNNCKLANQYYRSQIDAGKHIITSLNSTLSLERDKFSISTERIDQLEKALKKEVRKSKAVKISGVAIVTSLAVLLILK